MSWKNYALTSLAAGVILVGIPFAVEGSPYSEVNEDDASWSCVDDGNKICGPGNAQGAPAGCYDDGGVLLFRWPCHVQDLGDGQTDFVPDPGSPDYDPSMLYV